MEGSLEPPNPRGVRLEATTVRHRDAPATIRVSDSSVLGILIHPTDVFAALRTREPSRHHGLLDTIPANMPRVSRAIVDILGNAIST